MNTQSVRVLPPETIVAQRYVVEALLGRGGMAAVYRVRDLTTQREVALKRLTGPHAVDDPIARLFEREFCTLSQLVHPRIIEVYDYQTDDDGAFYTMELLNGGDLRKRAPIGWVEACRLLCDVCSALSLLHSRRFVHRDLTPLNVRCTADGRAKLIDFGSMAQFGRSKHVVGTPPFVAPESLNGELIDGKTDLFALGATAYYALTGRHAYPARKLAELPELWQSAPSPPSRHAPDIPPALDELVLALLSPAPSGRPFNAAEVMERLSAIGGFELEEALRIQDAYVSTPTLVGRVDALAGVDAQLRRALDGHGGALLVTGERGAGLSRFLDACRLEAKLRGLLVLSTGADELSSEPWAAASALLDQLRTHAPELVAELTGARAEATSLFERLPLREAGTSRAELQVALRETLLSVALRRPLLLMVDDIDRIDEPSAALFALLAHHAADARLLVLATAELAESDQLPKSLELLAAIAEEISLGELSPHETLALVSSVFGSVANVRLLADRIHAASGGNPGLVMHMCHHMVARGRVRYAAGQWTLPSKLDIDELPAASLASLDDGLSDRALELARALAVAGATARSFDACLQLSGHRDRKRLFADLHALCSAGVLSMDVDCYRVSSPGFRALLLSDLDPALERGLHRRVAELLADDPRESFRVIQHLLLAGEKARALDLWLSDARQFRESRISQPSATSEYLGQLPKDWSETFHALIAACAELGRPLSERLLLQTTLLAYSTLLARSESATLLAVAEQLRHDTGLDVYEALGDSLPHETRLQEALATAQRRYDETPSEARGLPLGEAIVELARTILQANGVVGRTLDYALLASLPSLKPLMQLSPALNVVQKTVDSTLHILSGRLDHALDGYGEVLRLLDHPEGVAGLDETHRAAMYPAIMFALGSIEAQAGRPIALERARRLLEIPWFAVSGLRLQTVYAQFQGDARKAEHYRAQTELFEIQNQPAQLLEGSHLLQWMLGCVIVHDIAGVKQSIADIDAMARDYPTWQPVLHCARATYQALRGDYARALPEYESALRAMEPGRHVAWALCAAAHVNCLSRLGRLDEAIERGRQYLKIGQQEMFGGVLNELLLRLAEAENRRGDPEQALARVELAIEMLTRESGRGVRLGECYEISAWIALQAGDAAKFNANTAAMEELFQVGSHPLLLSRHERLLQAARNAGLISANPNAEGRDSSAPRGQFESQMSTVFNQARGPEQRAQQALERVVRQSRAAAGCLYLMRGHGAQRVAQLGNLQPSADLDARVTAYLIEQANRRDTTDTKSTTNHPEDVWTDATTSEFQLVPMLLCHAAPDGRVVTGVAVMELTPRTTLRTPARLLQSLSRAFHEAQDTTVQARNSDPREL